MLRNKFLFASPGVPVSLFAGSPVKFFNSLTRSLVNPLTHLLANRLTILLLCFLSLFSISLAQEQFVYDAKGKRNPFIPLVTPDGRLLKLEQEEGTAGLALEGIVYDKNGVSYAIINGEVVRIGDKVGDYQVLKIEEKKVIFIKDGEPTEVDLKKEDE
jgi:hypothetical protein